MVERYRPLHFPRAGVRGLDVSATIYVPLLVLDEELVIPQPSWVTYGPQAHLSGKPVTSVPTRLADGFRIRHDVLRGTLRPRTTTWATPRSSS